MVFGSTQWFCSTKVNPHASVCVYPDVNLAASVIVGGRSSGQCGQGQRNCAPVVPLPLSTFEADDGKRRVPAAVIAVVCGQ
jgi:hypothetical protein